MSEVTRQWLPEISKIVQTVEQNTYFADFSSQFTFHQQSALLYSNPNRNYFDVFGNE